MSALQRLPFIAGMAGLGVSLSLLSLPSVRWYVSRYLGLSAPGGIWRILAIIFALLNLKNLPFVWHIRLFRALIYHLYLQPTRLTPELLFQPIITSSRSPLTECDYNLHKSNSTYFTDLDISRTHLVTALLRTAIRHARNPHNEAPAPAERNGATSAPPTATSGKIPVGAAAVEAVPTPTSPTSSGAFTIALGAVSAHFRREVPPYARYDVWTRLLCWDRKWLYLVSHVVAPGVARPAGYGLQPWKRGHGGQRGEQERERLRAAVYASSVAKYVVKRGRMTVPPEVVLARSGLLPPGPDPRSHPPSSSSSSSASESSSEADGAAAGGAKTPYVLDESFFPAQAGAQAEWTWEMMERERVRGLRLAEMFGGLDGLHEVFDGGEKGVLGKYPDLLW